MPKRKLSKEERKHIHYKAYSMLGKPEIISSVSNEKELEKAKELEKERQEKRKKQLKREKRKLAPTIKTAAIDEAIRLVISDQVGVRGPFQCPFCSKLFDTQEELSGHIKANHPEAVQEAAQIIHQKRWQEEEYRRQQGRRRGALLRLRRKRLGGRS